MSFPSVRRFLVSLSMVGVCVLASHGARADDLDDVDTVIRALVDELKRSMDLQLEDLEKPYFIQYSVNDQVTHRMSARYGALVGSDRNRSRRLQSQVRVGSYELDNTNFAGGGRGFGGRGRGGGGRGGARGGGVALPIDDDYTAIRQATWRATDRAYKSAVETLAEKQAYLEDVKSDDRSADFTKMPPVLEIADKVTLEFDGAAWEDHIRQISARFAEHAHVLDSSVNLSATASNRYLINSEGSRLRDGDHNVVLSIRAEVQAEDGEILADGLDYRAASSAELPSVATIATDVDALAQHLGKIREATRLEEYIGPVLFDGLAAAQMFQQLMANGVAGQPETVGNQRRRFRGGENLEKRLGKRVLPGFLSVYDDPREPQHAGQFLAGHYLVDDDGMPAKRVDLVVAGKMRDMLMSRVPTATFEGSNGHGRGAGTPRAAVGCLFIESTEGRSDEELKADLIAAAKEQGLDYALRVRELSGGGGGNMRAQMARFRRGGGRGFRGGGGGGNLADPIAVYKVSVADGSETPLRAAEFGEIGFTSLREIVAAGKVATVYNTANRGVPASIIAPAVLIEELELMGIEAEQQRLPLTPAPHARKEEGEK